MTTGRINQVTIGRTSMLKFSGSGATGREAPFTTTQANQSVSNARRQFLSTPRSFSCSPSGAAQTQTTTFNRPSLSNAPISERGKHTESEVRRDTKIDAAELGCLLFHRARASTVRSSAVPSASASRHQDRSHAVRTQHNDSAISAAATPPASCRHHSRAR